VLDRRTAAMMCRRVEGPTRVDHGIEPPLWIRQQQQDLDHDDGVMGIMPAPYRSGDPLGYIVLAALAGALFMVVFGLYVMGGLA
jgi:hypothetical protein